MTATRRFLPTAVGWFFAGKPASKEVSFTGFAWEEAQRQQHLLIGQPARTVGEPRRLTPRRMDAGYPTWMPDSKEILFSARGSLWRLVVPGENTPARLPFAGEDGIMPVVSRLQSGRQPRLVYVRSFQDSNIWRVESSASGAPASAPPVVSISSTRRTPCPSFLPTAAGWPLHRIARGDGKSGWPILTAPTPSNSLPWVRTQAPRAGLPMANGLCSSPIPKGSLTSM